MVKSMMSTMATALVAADDLGLLQAARTTIASPTTTDSEDEAHVLLLQASTQQSRGKVAGSASPTVERALVATASWRALTGQWVQWSEDSMPAECLLGNSKNAPGTKGFEGAFTKVPLTCCTKRSNENLLIFNNFPKWTVDNFPKGVCKDMSKFFGAPAGSSYALAACDAAGTSWYGEDCTSGDIATKCNCARLSASTSQPACFRAGDLPDNMKIDAKGTLAGKVRWFAYHAGCASTATASTVTIASAVQTHQQIHLQ